MVACRDAAQHAVADDAAAVERRAREQRKAALEAGRQQGPLDLAPSEAVEDLDRLHLGGARDLRQFGQVPQDEAAGARKRPPAA
jgi:hypothetical protein